jgi:hypothetical protein
MKNLENTEGDLGDHELAHKGYIQTAYVYFYSPRAVIKNYL